MVFFFSTKSVATVFNHFALHRLYQNVSKTIYIKEEIALKLHYKNECPIESRMECSQLKTITINDTSLDRFADKLIESVENTLNDLNLWKKI